MNKNLGITNFRHNITDNINTTQDINIPGDTRIKVNKNPRNPDSKCNLANNEIKDLKV